MGRTAQDSLRIALISTPRSGNTWLRHLLASLFDLRHEAIHRPSDVDWGNIPERCLLQLHWHRTDPLMKLLDRHGFQVVVLARHPFDTLISLLSWVNNCPDPSRLWKDRPTLDGDGGDELPLLGLHPCSPGFVEYATGPRARTLIDVSTQWWQDSRSHRVRYEDLVQDTSTRLADLVDSIGQAPRRPIAEVIEQHSMEGLRKAHPVRALHFWQGHPGLWKQLLTSDQANRIASALGTAFERFGYACDPDEQLGEDRAVANWFRLQYESLRRESQSRKRREAEEPDHRQLVQSLGSTRAQLDTVHRLLYDERVAHEKAIRELKARDVQLDLVHRLLYESQRKLANLQATANSKVA